ncbi:response regulator [Mucilaginibacter gilvus]|uniref:Response regulator n=1 Tax=Mucilaginibacter gilvus TaxID=2305909 RepID=A0A444MQ93_9SPHI|nr:response regulator [Mucilaginibacter gilvus]RWY53763.1 response regulator [Mucilaginibacter gilvus]
MDSYMPLNVLVIDDDVINNFIFERLTLKVTADIMLAFCLNGEEAIDYLQSLIENARTLPDIIFLDLTMPVMNGWDFLEEYHRLNLDSVVGAKVYIITSSIFNLDIERALGYAIVKDFITKPISTTKLEQILGTANSARLEY